MKTLRGQLLQHGNISDIHNLPSVWLRRLKSALKRSHCWKKKQQTSYHVFAQSVRRRRSCVLFLPLCDFSSSRTFAVHNLRQLPFTDNWAFNLSAASHWSWASSQRPPTRLNTPAADMLTFCGRFCLTSSAQSDLRTSGLFSWSSKEACIRWISLLWSIPGVSEGETEMCRKGNNNQKKKKSHLAFTLQVFFLAHHQDKTSSAPWVTDHSPSPHQPSGTSGPPTHASQNPPLQTASSTHVFTTKHCTPVPMMPLNI